MSEKEKKAAEKLENSISIKIGEYVRTKKHGIFKVEKIRKTPYGYLCGTTDNERVPTFTIGKGCTAEIKNDIVKHSPNLIDLIQCGDYVNGETVNKNKYGELYIGYVYAGGEIGKTLEPYATFIKDIKEEDIETIVTKEQFESISYKVTKM